MPFDKLFLMNIAQDAFTSHRVLAHPQGFVGQVAWFVFFTLYVVFSLILFRSPSGNTLLTRLSRGIKIWTEVCNTTRKSLAFCQNTGFNVFLGRRMQKNN
jgi:hypothetical protein